MGVTRKRTRGSIGSIVAIWLILLALLAGCAGADANEAANTAPSTGAANAETAAPPDASPASIDETPSETQQSGAVTSPPASEIAKPADNEGSEPAKASPPPKTATPSAEPSSPIVSEQPAVEVEKIITFSIVGNAEWGTIVDGETVELKDGDTAASVLKRVAKAHRLAYEIRGSGAMTYIEGIDGLYEFDHGPTSGWKFRVNGQAPDIGAGAYELKPGDRLEWLYVESDELAESGSGEEPRP
ncbi:DUF4430 domain-containing protein [Cohnella sp. GCM10027633]|uniref:DUF4430 domain-containing protein n=1 Tax=unclassified Cohnella TaxID=2636738 RepID=UPI0036427825